MTQEEYNQLDSDFAHCAGTHCEKTDKCLRHTAYKMLAGNGNETYTVLNPAVIKGGAALPVLRARPLGTLCVGYIEHLQQREGG